MPLFAASLKVTALAVALVCVGAGSPAPADVARSTLRAPTSRTQCRMYFGCVPIASINTSIAQQQE